MRNADAALADLHPDRWNGTRPMTLRTATLIALIGVSVYLLCDTSLQIYSFSVRDERYPDPTWLTLWYFLNDWLAWGPMLVFLGVLFRRQGESK